jgi:hypothetical protein
VGVVAGDLRRQDILINDEEIALIKDRKHHPALVNSAG